MEAIQVGRVVKSESFATAIPQGVVRLPFHIAVGLAYSPREPHYFEPANLTQCVRDALGRRHVALASALFDIAISAPSWSDAELISLFTRPSLLSKRGSLPPVTSS